MYKREIRALPNNIQDPKQAKYSSVWPLLKEVVDNYVVDTTKYRRTPKNVHKLLRYYGRVPKTWIRPDVTCSFPLWLYSNAVHASGQSESWRDLNKLVGAIGDKLVGVEAEYLSDAWRSVLKEVSAACFPLVFERGPAFMLFVHLHWLTAKCPYTTEQIVNDIDAWVSDKLPGGCAKAVDADAVERALDRIFLKWYRGEAGGHLSFREYCNDFVRWGTSGGAPKVQRNNMDYRSKWAWALDKATDPKTGQLKDDYDLYEMAKKERVTSVIALKEEPAKTREIITTTMASYLRQSYLMYRWGKPRIPSPISDSGWMGKFERKAPRWYGSIDGERFDHCVPKEFIYGVLRRLGKLDGESEKVVEEEIAHMDTLEVVWNDKTWKWKGGLLSGWRITSVIGSLLSCCVAEYIIEKTKMVGALEYGVMGDDLILYSYVSELSADRMVEEYKAFGLMANLTKTSSGHVGEFLRRVLSRGGTWAYPALGLRSVCYANPWVDHYTYNEETEVSNVWMTFLSRMIPHACNGTDALVNFTMARCVRNLQMLFGRQNWVDWLRTPISAGGGGCMEFSDVRVWCHLDKLRPMKVQTARTFFDSVLGLIPYRRVMKRTATMEKLDLHTLVHWKKQLRGVSTSFPKSWFKHEINITQTIYNYMFGSYTLSTLGKSLQRVLPRGLRTSSPQRVIEFLLRGVSEYTGMTTIQHTKDSLNAYTEIGAHVVRAVSASKRFVNIRYIAAAVTMYMSELLKSVYIPYGTW